MGPYNYYDVRINHNLKKLKHNKNEKKNQAL